MKIEATTQDAYKLFHEGTLALADAQYNGIRINEEYCKKTYKQLKKDIKESTQKLYDFEEIKEWKKKYKKKFNLNSGHQMKDILFEVFDYEPVILTEKRNPSVNQEALEALNVPFTQEYVKRSNLLKIRNTYFKNIIKETIDGRLHPFYNLDLARSFRSSSSNPNFQNIPVRDKITGPMVRKAFLASIGHRLLEIDYGGIEVKGACWNHCDPKMLDYLWDTSKDMHADSAIDCYKLDSIDKEDKSEKDIRYCAKNKFVFPEFYGDYYGNCARNLWNAMLSMDLRLKDGTPVVDHLKTKGIKSKTQFENHIKKVEDIFWNQRFKKYKQWKETYYQEYLRKGELKTLTGFVCKGVMKKNHVLNYPTQSIAFHVLLWSLIRLNKILKEQKWKTKIIGQIHDSIIFDAHAKEVRKLIVLAEQVMCHEVKEYWRWINTPLEIEIEGTPIDGNWSEKSVIHLPKKKAA